MIHQIDDRLVRIGVFYDGGFLQFVSDYYRFHHPRRARLSIRGVHNFIESQVAREESIDRRYCHVVDAHYFRGRYSVDDAVAKGKLEGERAFDDVLMRENVVTHYLLRTEMGGEKGIDVWFALEAYELAVVKRFNVVAMIAGDGDYLPLVRKLNALGTRVVLLAWDFTYQDDQGRMRETRTAQTLVEAATYPISMHDLIDNTPERDQVLVDGLFTETRYDPNRNMPLASPPAPDERKTGTIAELRRDRFFGIIDDGERTWLFLSTELEGASFDRLREGDRVSFGLQPNPEKPGQFMASRVTVVADASAAQSAADELPGVAHVGAYDPDDDDARLPRDE